MGFNWSGFVRGAATGIANTASKQLDVMISDEVAQKREARMAQYRQSEQSAQFAQQDKIKTMDIEAGQLAAETEFSNRSELQEDAQRHQYGMHREEISARARAAEQKAVADEINRQKILADKKDFEEFKGAVNPDSPKNQTEGEKLRDKQGFEMKEQLRNSAAESGKIQRDIDRIREITSNFETGRISDAEAAVSEWLGGDKGAARQTLQSYVSNSLLGRIGELGQAPTDADMKMLFQTSPSFANDPRANELILSALQETVDRSRNDWKELQAWEKSGKPLYNFVPSYAMDIDQSPASNRSRAAGESPLDVLTGFKKWDAEN